VLPSRLIAARERGSGFHVAWLRSPFPREFIDQQLPNILQGFDTHYAIHYSNKDEFLIFGLAGLKPSARKSIIDHLKSSIPKKNYLRFLTMFRLCPHLSQFAQSANLVDGNPTFRLLLKQVKERSTGFSATLK
jgi:hypothetical protein